MIARGQAATRQLAKRQMTWLRKESGCHWLDETADITRQAVRIVRQGLAV